MQKPETIIRKVKKKIKYTEYARYQRQPLDEKAILLEAGQGLHVNGNVFALLDVLEKKETWKEYKPYVVVRTANKKEAEKKLNKNGFHRYQAVLRESDEYMRLLAKAKYLITDNSFPSYFVKREGQICLNTWHGTPLKRLGRQDIEHSTSIGNVQKNFLFADYLLFPNTYTRDIMMEDYMLTRLYRGKSVVIDYPRNDVLFDETASRKIREKHGLQGKKVLAYMPTWRGTGRNADVEKQVEDIERILHCIDEQLNEDEILYVNLHFLVNKGINYKKYKSIRKFPAEYETYAFLAACDGLISDYSSVMIDFAQTGRDVIMYMYDYEEYSRGKGFYFDIKTLPFKMAETEEELMEAIHSAPLAYELDASLVGENFGQASEKMLNLVCKGIEEGVNVTQWQPGEDVRVVHVGNLLKEEDRYVLERFIEGITEDEKKHTVLTFENSLTDRCLTYLKTIDPDVHFLRFVLSDFSPLSSKTYEAQERKRLMYGLHPSSMEFLQSGNWQIARMIASYEGKTVYHNIPPELRSGLNYRFAKDPALYQAFLSSFDEIRYYPEDFCGDIWESQNLQVRGIIAEFTGSRFHADDALVQMKGTVSVSSLEKDFAPGTHVLIGKLPYPAEMKVISEDCRNRIYHKTISMSLSIDAKELASWEVNNNLCINIIAGGRQFWVKLRSAKRQRTFKKTYNIPSIGGVCCFKPERQQFRLVVRY